MRIAALIGGLLLVLGCGSESAPDKPVGDNPPIHVRPVACGCALEHVGTCGNYVEVDGKFMPLTGDVGLGPMEFCKKNGLQAEVAGMVHDGEFVASWFKLVESDQKK